MPIYEYRCSKCGKQAGFLVRNVAAHRPPACPKCGRAGMVRALSRFAAVKGGRRGDAAPDGAPAPAGAEAAGPPPMPDLPGLDDVDERDPRSMGRALRQMAGQAGEPLEPEMEEMVRRLEGGEDPESIEDRMGDPPGGDAGGGDDTLYDG